MLEKKAAGIRLLILDVDGVLTDGRITLNERGEEIKSFNVKDGLGLQMVASEGIEVVILTGRTSKAVAHRARELGIAEVYQGIADKRKTLQQLISQKGLDKTQVCCIGDDLPDLPMFGECGICVAVSDAVSEIRQEADFITRTKGGWGAVREVCDWLLRCKGRSPKMSFTE
ncbi:MAG: HAD-IIIA family hydrolase [Deltaproteobacteria bacterium]|nr:HAD-IIIA family hydrolase [Deltaproteobacteria bacterium]